MKDALWGGCPQLAKRAVLGAASGNYIPMKVTKEGAIKAALEADGNVLVAAGLLCQLDSAFVCMSHLL